MGYHEFEPMLSREALPKREERKKLMHDYILSSPRKILSISDTHPDGLKVLLNVL